MKNRKLIILGMVPLLLAGCGGAPESSSSESNSSSQSSSSQSSSSESSSVAPGYFVGDVEIPMLSHYGIDGYKETAHVDESWFFADSADMNPGLAFLTACSAGAAANDDYDKTGKKLSTMLTAMDYEHIEANAYYAENITTKDSIGVLVGSKTIVDAKGETYTLLGLFPRSSGYAREWQNNFNLGEQGMHPGFKASADEALRFLKHFIEEHEIEGHLKLWAAGYSRGAAITNLVAGILAQDSEYLGENVTLLPKDIFAYNVATPGNMPLEANKSDALSISASRGEGYRDTEGEAFPYKGEDGPIDFSDDAFDGIHNLNAVGDPIPTLPLKQWGFTRYGTDHEVLYGGDAFASYLEEISPYAASLFENGKTFLTPNKIKTIDFETFTLVDSDVEMSQRSYLDLLVSRILGFAPDRASVVSRGFDQIIGRVASWIELEASTLIPTASANMPAIIKSVFLNYIAYQAKHRGKTAGGALADVLMDLLGLLGKEVPNRTAYSDLGFRDDLFDLLFNDYSGEKTRYEAIASLLPDDYGALYLRLLDYAQETSSDVRDFVDLLRLISEFYLDNAEDPAVDALLSTLGGIVPEDKVSLLAALTGETFDPSDYPSTAEMAKAIIVELLPQCALGRVEGEDVYSPDSVRGVLAQMIAMYLSISGAYNLSGIVTDGAVSGEERIHAEPISLETACEDIVTLLCPKNENDVVIPLLDGGAEASLSATLGLFKNEGNAETIELLQNKSGEVAELLFIAFFGSPADYSLESDIKSVMAAVQFVPSLGTAHLYELYICALKAMVNE